MGFPPLSRVAALSECGTVSGDPVVPHKDVWDVRVVGVLSVPKGHQQRPKMPSRRVTRKGPPPL